MALRSDRCICLRVVEYSETSQILTLFGRSIGLFRVIAKGAHRRTKAGESRFDGGADLMDLGDAVMTDPADKDLATLTEWRQLNGRLELRRNQRTLYLALYAVELANLFLHDTDPAPAVFDLLNWLFDQLPTDRREECFIGFELELLRHTGFLPELGQCVACGQPLPAGGRIHFSYTEGGGICPQCPPPTGPRGIVETSLLRILQTISRLPRVQGIPQRLPRLTPAQIQPANRLLADYFRHLLGHDLRLATYVL